VYLTSERESALTEDGELTLVDSESGAEMNIEITDAALSAYENALKEHKGRISEICRKYGVDFTEIKTEDNFSKILVKILC
jgi:predicted Fe-Mo cluster-binding NifX family protein